MPRVSTADCQNLCGPVEVSLRKRETRFRGDGVFADVRAGADLAARWDHDTMLGPINQNPDEKTLRQFGWIMLGGCGGLGWLLGWLRLPSGERWTGSSPGLQGAILLLWTAGAAVFVVSRVSPGWTRAGYVGWMRATRPVGVAVFTAGLTVMFLAVLPVFSLILRLSDPLRRTLRPSGSYWEDVKPYDPTPQRMARPF